jgi:hypothetical protein|nr:MAG TPA: hypothetical protein [Caudoviricetes sp.]
MEEQDSNKGLINMPDLSVSSVCKDLFDNFFASIKSSQDGRVDIPLDNRIKNIAYSLASPIANSIGTSEPTEPQLNTFVKKNGDNMSGRLGTLFGFQAGEDGKIFFQTIRVTEGQIVKDQYISIEEKLKINSDNLLIDNKIIFNHYIDNIDKKEKLKINGGDIIDFINSDVKTTGTLAVGSSNTNGFYVSSDTFTYFANNIYHSGNSNRADVNWTMKDSEVKGNLSVARTSTLKGQLDSLFGVKFGVNGQIIASIQTNQLEMNGDISLGKNNKIKYNNINVLGCPSDFHIQLSSIGGALILGGTTTSDIRLWSTLKTEAGDHDLIDKFGHASFMNSFQAGYGFGNTLISTDTESVIIHDKLRFRDKIGPFISVDTCGIGLTTKYIRNSYNATHRTTINIEQSTSIYADQSKNSESVFIDSTADFFTFNNPIEAKGFIGIQESTTRLSENTLFFTDNNRLVNISDGIKHFGNSYFINNLSSERFSTGFAGEGWAIRKKLDTGNVELTVDEAVIRKKMRVYELEIQKINVVNGSLWVSDSCSADKVTTIP